MTKCRLQVENNGEVQNHVIPIRVQFNSGQIVPEVDGIVFSSVRSQDLIGQSREMRIRNLGNGGSLIIRESPEGFATQILDENMAEAKLRITVMDRVASGASSRVVSLGRSNEPNVAVPLSVHTFVGRD